MNTKLLIIIAYKGSKVQIYFLEIQLNGLEYEFIIKKKEIYNLTQNIDHLIVSYNTYILASFNHRDDSIQFIQFHPDSILTAYAIGYHTKIECISFYQNGYIIIASKDQSIKVVLIQDLYESINNNKNYETKIFQNKEIIKMEIEEENINQLNSLAVNDEVD